MLGNTKHLVTLAVKLWCHNGLQLHTMMIRVIRMLCASLMEEREDGKKGEREEGKEGRKEGGREGRKRGLIDQQMKDLPACPVSLDKVKMATSDGPYSTGAGMGVNWGQ